jgi:hypothetical protein
MIRNVTNKPTMAFRFVAVKYTVLYWVEVNARGKKLRSDPMDVADNTAIWAPEVYAKLSTLLVAYSSAERVMCTLWAERPIQAGVDNYARQVAKVDNTSLASRSWAASFQRFKVTFDPAKVEVDRLQDQLESLLMTTRSFMERLGAEAIPLKVEPDDSDDRRYALNRGSVWSCVRDLEAGQWKLLVDRVIKSGDAELATALAEETGTSQTRERLSAEVRRAVWVRDQGKCARCGNRERLEFDHIVPVSRGGSNTERNVELLCEVCNRAKSDSIM